MSSLIGVMGNTVYGGKSSVLPFAAEVAADVPFLWAKMDDDGVSPTLDWTGTHLAATLAVVQSTETYQQTPIVNDGGYSIDWPGGATIASFGQGEVGGHDMASGTVEVWCNPDTLAEHKCISLSGNMSLADTAGYGFFILSTGALYLQGYASGAWRGVQTAAGVVTTGNDYQLSVTFDTGPTTDNVIFYKNGVEVSKHDWSWGKSNNNSAPWRINHQVSGVSVSNFFDGRMDHWICWKNDVLSASRIAAHYAAGTA